MMVDHTHIKIDQVFSRVSTYCKSRSIFTREQQAAAFKLSYKELPIHVTTLRSLANFKAAIAGNTQEYPGIQKPRPFEIRRPGSNAVTVGMKEYMHSTLFTGMTADGIFTGAAPSLFKGAIPAVEDAPPFDLKKIDPEIVRLIRIRHAAVHARDALFPCDNDKQIRVKADMDESADLLTAEGSIEFNLSTWWLKGLSLDGYNTNGDSLGDTRDSESDSNAEIGQKGCRYAQSNVDGTAGNRGDMGEEGKECDGICDEEGGNGLPPPVGNLVFFVAEFSPFVVAEIIGARTTSEGVCEVHVHWWSPKNTKVRENAKDYSVLQYGNHAFAADYVTEAQDAVAAGKKRRRIADTDWEVSDSIVVSCEHLRADKKIPKRVLDTLMATREEWVTK